MTKINFSDWNSLASFLDKKGGLSDHINSLRAISLSYIEDMEIVDIIIEPTIQFDIPETDTLIKKLQSYLDSDSTNLDNLIFNVLAEAGLHNNQTQTKYLDLVRELNYNNIPFTLEVK